MWIVFPGLFVSRRISKKLAWRKGENHGSQEERGCCMLRHIESRDPDTLLTLP